MQCVVEVGDVPVLVSADEERRGAALEASFGRLPRTQAHPRIAMRYRVDGPALPSRPPDARSSEIQLWFEGPDMLAVERSGVSTRVSSDAISLGGRTTDPLGGLHRLLRPLLTHALFLHRRFLVHAGAIELRGRGVLLLGGSGMGKSTLAFAGHEAGWSVLGDDLAILRRRDPQTFEVAGLATRPLVVPGELLGDGAPRGYPVHADPRRRSALRELRTDHGWSRLACCVLVVHGDTPKGSMRRVDSRAALAGLLHSFLGGINPAALAPFFAAAHQLAQQPRFELAHGRDPAARLESAQTCLRALDEELSGGSDLTPLGVDRPSGAGPLLA